MKTEKKLRYLIKAAAKRNVNVVGTQGGRCLKWREKVLWDLAVYQQKQWGVEQVEMWTHSGEWRPHFHQCC